MRRICLLLAEAVVAWLDGRLNCRCRPICDLAEWFYAEDRIRLSQRG